MSAPKDASSARQKWTQTWRKLGEEPGAGGSDQLFIFKLFFRFFKHLAVAHKVVLKYVEKAREEVRPEGIKIKLSKLTNRMEPPPPSLQAFSGVAESLKNEEKRARDQTDQTGETEGGSPANIVIKSEMDPGPSTTPSTSSINQDIMNKIRNIFSDDSGSDSD